MFHSVHVQTDFEGTKVNTVVEGNMPHVGMVLFKEDGTKLAKRLAGA